MQNIQADDLLITTIGDIDWRLDPLKPGNSKPRRELALFLWVSLFVLKTNYTYWLTQAAQNMHAQKVSRYDEIIEQPDKESFLHFKLDIL